MSLCVHCNKRKICRPRGLCWHCYYSPAVRDLYKRKCPSAWDKGGNPGIKLPKPTDTIPGTPERIAVMEQRVANGESVTHPDDRKLEG